jgi:acetyltransferase-like isoleucine patch superfamily enzyme
MKKLELLLSLPWHDRINLLHAGWARFKTAAYYSRVLGSLVPASTIYKPLLLANPRFIHIGSNVLIRPGARMEVILLNRQSPPSLVIGNNVNIEQNVHIICGTGIEIGENVSIAPNCTLLDTKHPFRNIHHPQPKLGDRLEPGKSPIRIGGNTLIGFGCAILPDAQIGSNCVIGANSTVRGRIPDYSVAAGNPATVIMQYDFEQNAWVKLGNRTKSD